MKSIWKRISVLMAVVLLLTGCGKGNIEMENVSNDTTEKADYVYLPEYHSLNEYVDTAGELTGGGSSLYFTSYGWDEKTEMTTTKLYEYDMTSNLATELPFLMESKTKYMQYYWVNDDGSITAIIYEFVAKDETAGEGDTYYYLSKYDATGQLISETDISKIVLGENEWSYMQDHQLDSKGNLYFYDGERYIKGISADGQPILQVELDGYSQGLAMTADDRLFVTYFGSTGNGVVIKEVDTATGQLSENLENIPEANNFSKMFAGIDSNILYIQSGSDLYEYNLETKQSTKLFNWLDMNMNGDSINKIVQVDENTFATLETDWSGEEQDTQLVLIKKTKNEGLVQKKVLTLAVSWEDYMVKEAVIDFNKSSQTHKIEIKTYEPTEDTISSDLLEADIAAGNIPDIIDLGVMDYKSLIHNGVLTDLTPLMENDSEVTKDSLIEKALEPFVKENKLYAIPATFTVSTLMGKSSALNGKTSWNLEEYKSFVEGLPEGTQVMNYASKSAALELVLYPALNDFIDWENGTCSFDNEEFISMMEFANTFPEEPDFSNETSLPTKVQTNQLALMNVTFSSVEEYQMYGLMFEEPATCIGTPTENGSGANLQLGSNVFAITEECTDKEAAWDFIRNFYMVDSQTSGMMWGFPVSKDALEKKFEDAMKPEYIELEDGTKEETEKTTWGYDDWEAKIYAATPEQIEEIRDLIYNADGVMSGNSEELAIIREEVDAYFSGQKSAVEVADIIQSRMKIYVSENQ